MAETTNQGPAHVKSGPPSASDPTAAKNQGGEPIGAAQGDTVTSGEGQEAGVPVGGGKPQNELERQALAQIEADKKANKALADSIANTKRGRPSTADLEQRRADLERMEREQGEALEAGRAAIAARSEQGKSKTQRQADIPADEVGGVWARYVGPRDAEDAPAFVEMMGYTLERGGDWVFIKDDPRSVAKFRGNGEFQTEIVSKDEAESIDDGDTKEGERSAPKKRVGRTS